jgi:tetratricopeptide (TPR) repeat protein
VACPAARWSLVLGLSIQVGFGGVARASADEPRPADSAGASPVEQQRPGGADALIARGIQLRKAGDDRAALDAFEQAYAASGSAQALAQMALAEQALGRWVPALLNLERALAVRGDRWIDGHRATLEAAREEIASRLGQLEVSCNVPGALVEIDGEPIGQTPLPRAQPVVAGLSVVKVSAPGYFALTRQVQVDARGLARLDLTLTPVPVAASAASPPPSSAVVRQRDIDTSGTSTRDVLMYSSFGLAAAGLALGVTGYVVREINVSEYNDDSKCFLNMMSRAEECPDQYDAWRMGQTLAIVGFATAAVFGGVGLYLWLDRPEERTRQALGCSMSLGGVRCAGRF